MQVELHLPATSSRWRFTSGRISIGRDPACDVAVPADRYPMVSREHAVLIIKDGQWHLADSGSTNGTWINGAKTSEVTLKDRDRVRLGKDGPELEVRLVSDQPSAGQDITVVSPVEPVSPTQMGGAAAGVPTRIANASQRQTAAEGPASQPTQGSQARASVPRTSALVIEAGARSGISREEEQMIEQKLSSLKNLVYVLLALVAVLLGVIIYQGQQIDKNRAELGDLRKQAQNAVAQFTPALDQRLNALDRRLDQMDSKMKESEDHFMTRLNNDLPRMLDKYVDDKVKQLATSAEKATVPEQK